MLLVTVAGRMPAGDDVPFTGWRCARLLVLSATLTAFMVAWMLAFASSARADVACEELGDSYFFCLEKTATPDTVQVGESLTFTIRGFCTFPEENVSGGCGLGNSQGLTDTLPAGLEFVSATATGVDPATTCSESAGTVTCAPVTFTNDPVAGEVPFVAIIEVIPTQCGTFTNTATMNGGGPPPVSETFTVVGCFPTTKEQCKEGGYAQFGFENQGRCIKAVKQDS